MTKIATHDADRLARRLDGLARRRWSISDGFASLSLGIGEEEITLYARPAAADALLETITAAGAALEDARAEVATLEKRVATLEREVASAHEEARTRAARGGGAERGAAPAGRKHGASLEDLPAALIAPFQPNARTLAAAKEDPLIALAVQATKAMQDDASEVERARLLAMAYAASTGDLTRFWAARTQRSAKKLASS
ncbi:MAG TPA: hypothetical protein VGK30_00710 [Candidatus Binatia bacterium]|jgi:hypothetical protein